MPITTSPNGRDPAMRITAMPADTNPAGDIFGGWLLGLMDLGAASAARRRAGGRCVTAAIDRLSFLVPVKVGDEVSIYASVQGCGRTSIRIEVEAWRRPPYADVAQQVTSAMFTFVALDDAGRPRPVPPE